MLKNTEYWISKEESVEIYTSGYWNDLEIEKRKVTWISDGNYEECLSYLENSGLLAQYEASLKYISTVHKSSNLSIADLAAGIGWVSALLSKLPQVADIHCVDISEHRINELFEHAIKMVNGAPKKINRYIGSFYDLKFENSSMDLIYLSQAFHHAEKPLNLLLECDRVLKPKGRIILVGEHYISVSKIIFSFFKKIIRHRKMSVNFYELFPPDKILGDHYYRLSDYYFMFQSIGYSIKHEVLDENYVIYIADKNE